jgi:hypothetical protein
LIVILGGLLFARLRSKHAEKAPIALYGIVGAACVAILIYTVMGREVFSFRQSVEITTDNLEEHVKLWANGLGLGVSSTAAIPDAYFADTVTLRNGIPVTVSRAKSRPRFLQFQSTLSIVPEHQVALAKLTVAEAGIVMQEILLELARSKINYEIAITQPLGTQPTLALQGIAILRAVPITSNLSEGAFTQALDDVDAGITIARAALVLSLDRHSHAGAQSH